MKLKRLPTAILIGVLAQTGCQTDNFRRRGSAVQATSIDERVDRMISELTKTNASEWTIRDSSSKNEYPFDDMAPYMYKIATHNTESNNIYFSTNLYFSAQGELLGRIEYKGLESINPYVWILTKYYPDIRVDYIEQHNSFPGIASRIFKKRFIYDRAAFLGVSIEHDIPLTYGIENRKLVLYRDPSNINPAETSHVRIKKSGEYFIVYKSIIDANNNTCFQFGDFFVVGKGRIKHQFVVILDGTSNNFVLDVRAYDTLEEVRKASRDFYRHTRSAAQR